MADTIYSFSITSPEGSVTHTGTRDYVLRMILRELRAEDSPNAAPADENVLGVSRRTQTGDTPRRAHTGPE